MVTLAKLVRERIPIRKCALRPSYNNEISPCAEYEQPLKVFILNRWTNNNELSFMTETWSCNITNSSGVMSYGRRINFRPCTDSNSYQPTFALIDNKRYHKVGFFS